MDSIAQIFARAAGNIGLMYYRRWDKDPLEKITDGELRACIFFAILGLALGGGGDQPRLQITYQGE